MPETEDPTTQAAGDGHAAAAGEPGKPPVCTVAFCPICLVVTAAQGAAPDTLEHLLAAAREFFLAARAVIDVRGDDLEGKEPNPNGARDFERIEIS
ncbi:MAG TPA: hypothetical protein VIC58_09550 [Actinomycetota bacterium]